MGHEQGYRFLQYRGNKEDTSRNQRVSRLNQVCCIHPPLFDIDLDHVVLDELHLMMRITDRLTDCVITEVMERDSKSDFLKKKGEEKGMYL